MSVIKSLLAKLISWDCENDFIYHFYLVRQGEKVRLLNFDSLNQHKVEEKIVNTPST